MEIRRASLLNLERIMDIYANARGFMAKNGNPHQWGRSWPPEELVRSDIAKGICYVCVCGDRIVGVFSLAVGEDVEPAYRHIEGGAWIDGGPYGVVHRLAGDGSVKGIGAFCLKWAMEKCGHLRIDTHEDNAVMRGLLDKLGFSPRGVIRVAQDGSQRIAYEKTEG